MKGKLVIIAALLLLLLAAMPAGALQHPATETVLSDGLPCGQDTFEHGDYGLGFINGDDDFDHRPPPPTGRPCPPWYKRASLTDLLGRLITWLS